MSDDESVEQLRSQVGELSAELAELKKRVAQLERGARPAAELPNRIPIPARYPVAVPTSSSGLKLLNRVGALTLFIGVLFFFKYAVDNAWIGPSARVLIGLFAGAGLLVAGWWLRRRGQITFAQGVSACGLATLYLSAYAGAGYYQLISPLWVFIAFVFISIAGLGTAARWSDAVLAIVAYLGVVAAPGLFRHLDEHIWNTNVWTWFGFAYLVAVEIIALRLNQQAAVAVAAAAVAIEAFVVVNPKHPVVCVLFFLVLAALHLRPGKTNDPVRYVIGHIFVIIAGMRFLIFWLATGVAPEARSSILSELESVFLAIYGVVLLATAVVRRSALDRMIGLTLLGLVIAKLYVFDVWQLTRVYRISAFVALGIILLASSFVYSRWKRRDDVS